MKIYIDSDFKCRATNPDAIFREIEEPFFDGKCKTFIEGYRVKPAGETWVRGDGKVFFGGKMVAPWKPYSELDAAQREYERQKLSNCLEALQELGVET